MVQMRPAIPAPSSANDYLMGHVALMRDSYRALTGRDLIDPSLSPHRAAEALFHAPFALLSHNADADPLMTYANRTGLALFEVDWPRLVAMHSRDTAELPNREERARLLERVGRDGFIDDYSGVRVSSNGLRFLIERATVWNLVDEGGPRVGQAATFSDWHFVAEFPALLIDIRQ